MALSSAFPRVLAVLAACGLLAACDQNPFDAAQKPVVTVQPGAPPVIAWTPAGARLVRVYRGTTAGDGYTPDLVWWVAGAWGNGLRAPIPYGVVPAGATADVPAAPLVAGQPYTVWVLRDDPEGSGEGFSNTRNRYAGTATFTP